MTTPPSEQRLPELLRLNVSTSNVRKTAEVFQAQFIDKLVDVPVDMPRQVPAVQVAQRTAEIPQVQFIDRVVDASVVQQRQVPMVQTVQKTMQNPRSAVPGRGCRHARFGATQGAHGPEGAENG